MVMMVVMAWAVDLGSRLGQWAKGKRAMDCGNAGVGESEFKSASPEEWVNTVEQLETRWAVKVSTTWDGTAALTYMYRWLPQCNRPLSRRKQRATSWEWKVGSTAGRGLMQRTHPWTTPDGPWSRLVQWFHVPWLG
ncbi:hypothetical protein PMIN06_006626 [Paraphaeosphaeria minitans]